MSEINVVPSRFESFFSTVSLAWNHETGNDPRWGHPSVPRESGQCAVTAMIVQDFYGGEILRAVVTDSGSHYWNRIDGVEVDFTRAQFQKFELEGDVETRERAYLEENSDTVARYTVLRERVFPEGC